MHRLRTRHGWPTKVAAAASVVVLGLSLALSGCGRHTTNDGTNAGNPGGSTTTSQTGGTTGGGTTATDLQSISDSVSVDLNSLATDENAAMDDQSNQDLEVQP